MAQEIQQPIVQNGSNNNHALDEIKSLFEGEHKVWLEKKSWTIKNCFPRVFKKIIHETRDSDSAEAEEADENLRRIVTESKLPSHKIHGFENEIEGLRNFVLKKEGEDEFKALAVVGQPGIGKTTLCQMIFNDEDVKNRFLPRIWVSMFGENQGNENPKIAIVKRILENLGVGEEIFECIQQKTEQEGELGFENRLLSRLMYVLHLQLWGKKFLIVLDDVCRSDGWDEKFEEQNPNGEKNWGTHVACGFPKMSGGRVIVSSRNGELAEELVGEDNLHRMFPITDHESCWSIYWDAVVEENSRAEADEKIKKSYEDFVKKIEKGDVKNLKKCKEELMNKTGGVPLAARLLKRVLPEEYVPPVKLDDDNQTDTDVGQNNTDQNNTQPEGTEQNDAEQNDTGESDGDQAGTEENGEDRNQTKQPDSNSGNNTDGTSAVENNTEKNNTQPEGTEQNDGDQIGTEENGGDQTDSNQTDNDSAEQNNSEQNGTVDSDSGKNDDNRNAGTRAGSDQTRTNTDSDESSTDQNDANQNTTVGTNSRAE